MLLVTAASGTPQGSWPNVAIIYPLTHGRVTARQVQAWLDECNGEIRSMAGKTPRSADRGVEAQPKTGEAREIAGQAAR
jgi:hypothetical protein